MLTLWNEAKDYELADDIWHVTSLYDNARSKIENLGPEVGYCYQYENQFSSFMCNTAVKARTEFTPRGYPDHTSIRTLMPPSQDEQINDPPQSVYEPPDVFNENLHPPVGAVDVLNIIEAGVPFKSNLVPDYAHFHRKPQFKMKPTVPIGKGHYLSTYSGKCDGSVDSWCNKGPEQKCLLYNHNDGRNGILMDSYSGWMVTNLPDIKHGFILLKIETWHWPRESLKTRSWNSVNNEGRKLGCSNLKEDSSDFYHEEERELKEKEPEYCNDFRFEFALDGKITSLSKDDFLERTGVIQRVIEVQKMLEDPSLTGGQKKEVEFAFRMKGCKNDGKTFKLTHLYWS